MEEKLEAQGQAAEAAPKKSGSRARRIVIAVVAVAVVAVGTFVGHGIVSGDIAPSDAAAKYAGMNYLPEGEVTDYIATYREQMQLADASDEDWATFLAAYNLTPARLRYSTINQLVTDKLVRMKADELGLSASDEEVDASLSTLRDSMALGSDDIFRETVEAHGQTLDGLREVYRQAILKRLVLSEEVEMPSATDEQVKDYLKEFAASFEDPTVLHTYCLRVHGTGDGGEGDAEARLKAEAARKLFLEGEQTVDAFADLVREYSNDEELIENGGANGWITDSSEYSQAYLEKVGELELGGVSEVFREDESAFTFIWMNDSVTLPTDADEIGELDLKAFPLSLRDYLRDKTAYELWESAGDDYIAKLLEDANVVYYPMPANVPYNVDMNLADVQLQEVDENGSPVESASAAESAGAAGEGE